MVTQEEMVWWFLIVAPIVRKTLVPSAAVGPDQQTPLLLFLFFNSRQLSQDLWIHLVCCKLQASNAISQKLLKYPIETQKGFCLGLE